MTKPKVFYCSYATGASWPLEVKILDDIFWLITSDQNSYVCKEKSYLNNYVIVKML